MDRVFVYGSLLRGLGNHRLLHGSTYLGRATLSGATMHDLGAFPGLRPTPNGSAVSGEVYLVSEATLARLDALEGHPTFYRRSRRTVNTEAFGAVIAWVYFLAEPTSRETVSDGDWRGHYRAKH